jgi:chromosome segregation ATPase
MEWESRYSRAQRDNEAQETAWQRRADALGGVISSLGGWLVRTLEELGSEVCDKLSAELDEAGPEEHMPTRAKGRLPSDSSRVAAALNDVSENLAKTNVDASYLKAAKVQIGTFVEEFVGSVRGVASEVVVHIRGLRQARADAAETVERLETALNRSEMSAAAATKELTVIRAEQRDMTKELDRLRAAEKEVSSTMSGILLDVERREKSMKTYGQDLQRQLSQSAVEVHRQRMRINELEAMNMKLRSNRGLLEEDTKVTVEQLKSGIAQRDATIARQRLETEELKRLAAAEEACDGGANGSDHSPAFRERDATTAASHETLQRQNGRLADQIQLLQQRLEQTLEEKESALAVVEQQKVVIRQHEEVLNVLAYGRRPA